jgi:hypothetical protein
MLHAGEMLLISLAAMRKMVLTSGASKGCKRALYYMMAVSSLP